MGSDKTKLKAKNKKGKLGCVVARVKSINLVFYEWTCCSKVLHFATLTVNSVTLMLKWVFLNSVCKGTNLKFKCTCLHWLLCFYIRFVCVCWWCASLCLCVPPAAGVSTAVGLPAAAPAGPAGPAAAPAQPSEARTAQHPAWTAWPATALPHSGLVPHMWLQHSSLPVHQL